MNNQVDVKKLPDWMNAAIAEALERRKKLEALRSTESQYDRYQADPVAFCEEILGDRFYPGLVKVIESVRDNPVTIAKSSNAIGKTFSAARIGLWFYRVYKDSKVFCTAAPPYENLKNLLWSEIMTSFRKNKGVFSGHYVRAMSISRQSPAKAQIGSEEVEAEEASFIVGVPIPMTGNSDQREAKFSGKHAPHMLFIVDEGDAVPEEVYKGIESCMSGGMARLLIMFNPRAKGSIINRMEDNGAANVVELSAFDHPNVIHGIDAVPGAVDREVTVRRINQWTRPLQHGEREDEASCFTVPDYLVGHASKGLDGKEYPPLPAGVRKITQPEFSYMVLARYPNQSERKLIDEAWISAARSRWDVYVAQNGERPPAGVEPVMGVDMAEYGTDYNVAMLRYGGYVAKPTFWAGMDVDESTSKVCEIYRNNHVDFAKIDGTGIGSGVAPAVMRRLRAEGLRDARAVSIKVGERPVPYIKSELGEFSQMRDQIWWELREWLRKDGGATLPPDHMLLEELRIISYVIDDRGKIKIMKKDVIRDKLKRSPDRADALCLTFAPVERAKTMMLEEAKNA